MLYDFDLNYKYLGFHINYYRFRKGFKYVFRWLPGIHYHASDTLAPTGVICRTSMSDGTRFERNGSMMQTMIESLDESTYTGNVTMTHKGVSWSRKVKEDSL